MAQQLTIDQTAIDEVTRERQDKGDDAICLRIRVEGGGCSGFQYKYEWETAIDSDEDIVFGEAVVVDSLSLKYMDGSVIKFHNDMMGRMFQIDNPAANSSCGCGTSFSI